MKVEQKKEFSPITMILETEQEAEALWYLLGMSSKNFDLIHPPMSISFSTYNTMWRNLDAVYRPKEKE